MSKLEVNLVLLSITFFWSIQCVFFQNLPGDIPVFVFVTLSDGMSFVLIGAMFWKEFCKLTGKIVKHGLLLAALLFGQNLFYWMGCGRMEPDTVCFCSSAYVVFVPLVMLLFRKKATGSNWAGVAFVLIGLLLATGAHLPKPGHGLLLLTVSDILFAFYMVTLEQIIDQANPILLSLCQMFFMTLFGLAGWGVTQSQMRFTLPMDVQFWSSILIVAVFLHGFTTVMSIYVQRYTSALHMSLFFSLEVVFTLLLPLLFPTLLGTSLENVTAYQAIGCLLIVLGVLLSDGAMLPERKKERNAG